LKQNKIVVTLRQTQFAHEDIKTSSGSHKI
jgi:hypothetical protein